MSTHLDQSEPAKHFSEAPDGKPALKKVKVADAREIRTGIAPVKPEFLLSHPAKPEASVEVPPVDDDEAEAAGPGKDDRDNRGGKKSRKKGGQNKARKFHFSQDEVRLCQSLVQVSKESLFDGTICEYAANAPAGGRNRGKRGKKGGDEMETDDAPRPTKCDCEHNLREYLKAKKVDIEGVCPVWNVRGDCANGWRCRWVSSHSREENGGLVLVTDDARAKAYKQARDDARTKKFAESQATLGELRPQGWEKDLPDVGSFDDPFGEVLNNVPMSIKIAIRKNEYPMTRTKVYHKWADTVKAVEDKQDHTAAYSEPPPRPEEKRKLYFDRATPVLAPLTTTGNMPFRRLCLGFGAAITYSEMAMSTSLLSGQKQEWSLLKAHTTELPHFGAQICANKVDQACRVTEAITSLFPTPGSGRHGLSLVDLNCGCPIDLVYQNGGGSALLDQQGKLLKMFKGMNYVSGATPITCKIRMGARDNNPTAQKLITKVFDSGDVQAITLHGRSRQQRYTRAADWGYIAETAALIQSLKQHRDDNTDTAGDKERPDRNPVYFLGNGDCFSHVDYFNAVDDAKVDSVMVARGALIKPWIFEEIQTGQYIDKSATERLDMVKEYCRYGLECWGADELGVSTTRRFLLEWLSFTSRYVPIGILERLPPKIQDRPPLWKGRNELETMLGSHDYKDWIKISEMFLGPCPPNFFFIPKHKSNAYDAEAEG